MLNLINNKVLTPDHFHAHPTGRGVYLTRDGMKRFFGEYERFHAREFRHPDTGETVTFRHCYRIQAEQMARCIKEGTPYHPIVIQG